MANKTKHARAEGYIEVKTYEPTTFDDDAGAPKLVEIHVHEVFTGDIVGDGLARFIQAMRADGSASFVGIERVRGSLAGRKGSFLLQDVGTLVGKTVKGTWFVVPGSGTGELQGLEGDGGFTAELGEHAAIWLDYSFEAAP